MQRTLADLPDVEVSATTDGVVVQVPFRAAWRAVPLIHIRFDAIDSGSEVVAETRRIPTQFSPLVVMLGIAFLFGADVTRHGPHPRWLLFALVWLAVAVGVGQQLVAGGRRMREVVQTARDLTAP